MEGTVGSPVGDAPYSPSCDSHTADAARECPPFAPAQVQDTAPASTAVATIPDNMMEDAEDHSSSEMDLEVPSRSASPEPPPPTVTIAIHQSHAGLKRKLSAADDANAVVTDFTGHSSKKHKVSELPAAESTPPRRPPPRLPVEVWQHVFLHLPPAMLCRCLRVCKDFGRYLREMREAELGPGKNHPLAVVDSETIWTQSRKNFFPMLPRPLIGLSELDMLQLIGGRVCQFCARVPPPSSASSWFNVGPGQFGVRVIWPFGVRCCGACLESRIITDIDALQHPSYTKLRLAVPHGFRSPEYHFASESVRQLPGGIPGHLRFFKIYYKPDLLLVKTDEDNAKELGDGALDEWYKGLATQAKDAMADSARWEKWELQMRPGAVFAQVLREYDLSSFPPILEATQRTSGGVNSAQLSSTTNGTHPLPQPVHVFANGYGNHFPQYQPQLQQQHPQPQMPQHHFQQQQQMQQFTYQHYPPQQHQHQPFNRQVRAPREAEANRQARRAEIERRCRELDPPLEPKVLQHMDSFQAAMQITTPLTESNWEMLKPRILAQREAAELAEHARVTRLGFLQAAVPSVGSDDFFQKPAKETYDREYEQAQEPLRKRLGEYASDYINGQWGGGRMLSKDNAPIFAIQVLQQVRQRYYQDKELGLIPRFDPPEKRLGTQQEQGTPAPEPFLSLDNMKWVYDNKVRPLTDTHRREHFICAGCAEEKKPKWFAFEGLIQHYGAKHTTAFSKGNIVVHWQTAEWPEDAPFHTSPAHWLKGDRRTNEYKNHGRARNPPQGHHDSSYQAPSTAPNLPEKPYYSSANEYSNAGPGYPPTHFVAPTAQATSNGHFQHQQAPPAPTIDASHDTQLNALSSDASELWDALEGVKDFLQCIRVQTVIYHTVLRFTKRFHQKPTLDLLTDSLATNNMMRPLRNAHGIACKSCVIDSQRTAPSHSGSYWTRIRGVKLFNTSSLITHFKLVHLPHAGYLDWTKDMIEVPENQLVKDLLRTPGMDDDKLAIIAAAFSTAFPSPLPKIGQVQEEPVESGGDALTSRLLERLGKKQKNAAKKKGQKNGSGTAEREQSHDLLPQPNENEYDPRRPMFAQPQEEAEDPSQFDTDARRPATSTAPPPTAAFSLAPETLAALQNLTMITPYVNSHPANGRRSRSPSVGRSMPVPVSKPAAQAHASALTPTGQPDITAILASLTGKAPAPAQAAAPPASVSNRSGSAPRQYHAAPHKKPEHEADADQSDARHSNGRHEPVPQHLPQLPLDPRQLQDLQAALANNHQQFEQNQQLNSYPEATSYAPPAHSQPRYQYVYEGEQQQHFPPQPPPHTATYQHPPVQYVQMPPEQRDRYGYPYERGAGAPPKPIYVDQYGRPLELIPIDSAPAPVQYAPNSYEQQQYGREPSVYGQPVYDARRPVYYEQQQVSPGGTAVPPQRYAAYDDGRASVPRK